jgi:N6-adenosine-specific RNA methylase IME4
MVKHKFNIFPEASSDDFARLVSDIATNGYDASMPITLYQGHVLDGWNRWRACDQLGVTPATVDFVGTDAEAISFTMRTNKRRNLTSSQWAAIAVEAEEILAAIAEAVEAERRAKQAVSLQATHVSKAFGEGVSNNKLLQTKNPNENAVSTKAAEMFNTNRTYINEAKKLREESPEAFEKIKTGQSTLTQVRREIKEKKREARREDNRQKIATVSTPLQIATSGAKFATITIDPPWDWGDEGDQDQLGRARPDYSTMSMSELLELPVGDLADDDAHIYLWITNRSLPKGFALLEKWGFRYITAITWVKPHFGMGNYFRGQTEHVLFGVKGSQPLKRKDVGTVFHANRGPGGHSSKPEEFYSLVESCSPGPYLEMFSRSDRKDWVRWGENDYAA